MGIYNLSRTQLQAEIEILSGQIQELKAELSASRRLLLLEKQTRRELLAEVAHSTNLGRAVQLTLIKLRELVPFDLAGLFLFASESSSLRLLGDGTHPDNPIRSFPDSHPLVEQLKSSQQPIIRADIRLDEHLSSLEEMVPLRSWIGIPLQAEDRMVGFLSLGSLKANLYHAEQARQAADFIGPLAELIERALETESFMDQASNLEAISRLSMALGQVSSQEEMFGTILEQARRSFGAVDGAFFFYDAERSSLVLRYPVLEGLPIQSIPQSATDLLWQVFQDGSLSQVKDTQVFLHHNPSPLYQAILAGRRSALILPLKSGGAAFGILLLTFSSSKPFHQENLQLVDAVGQIISTTLSRFFTLQALETQLSLQRTRLIEKTEQAAAMQERQRLARELHDSVAQLIYSQVLFAGAGLKVLKSGDVGLTAEYLQRLHLVAQQALKEMRLLVFELRPSNTLDEGLKKAIQRRLDSVEKRSNLTVKYNVDEPLDLEPSVEIALYYIAMEALNNIVKHSGANRISVTIHSDPGRLAMTIEDDGCGFDLSQPELAVGMGLTNMHERAEAVGARLEIHSVIGKGTRIDVLLEGSHE
jgi:signal transduction histidine kinase